MNYEKWTFIVLVILAVEHFLMTVRMLYIDFKRKESNENDEAWNKALTNMYHSLDVGSTLMEHYLNEIRPIIREIRDAREEKKEG
jgi:hypothetical protein